MASTLGATTAAEIRAELARRRLSQRDFAVAVGQNQQWVSRRLSGSVPLTVDDVALIAKTLDVAVVALLGEAA
jgi:transcriptional regulator with XRE-family HTH domain